MAILVMFEAVGSTQEQYVATNDALGIRGDDDAPDGLITHVAGLSDDGVLVVDVWDSKENMESFFNERLRAALDAAGLAAGEPTILPVHNVIPQGAGKTAGTLVVIAIDGFSTDDYDAMASRMDAHTGDQSAHPAVQHVAAVDGTGMLVVDVWESPAAFAEFAETQIKPTAEAAGLSAAIEPRILPAIGRLRGAASVAT